MPYRSLFISALVAAAAGAFANVTTVVRVARPHERTPGTYLMVVLGFIAFAALASVFRNDRPMLLATLAAVTAAAALGFYWWTNPFGEWSGIAMLLLLPAQWALCAIPFVVRVIHLRRR